MNNDKVLIKLYSSGKLYTDNLLYAQCNSNSHRPKSLVIPFFKSPFNSSAYYNSKSFGSLIQG